LTPCTRSVLEGNADFLRHWTARAKDPSPDDGAAAPAPLRSIQESTLSLAQLVLALGPVPGAESGREALHSIVFDGASRDGLVGDATRRLYMGFIGPFSMSGYGFR